MILDMFSGGSSLELIINLFVRVFIIFCVLPIHEYAHALIAQKLGDETARLSGRLTISPLAHVDWYGAFLLVFAGVGWAKPVPINMRNFRMKNKKLAMAITAFAGPLSNIAMSFIFMVISIAISLFVPESNASAAIVQFFELATSINITLAVFNLIPVPPLDGSRLITLLVPDKYYYQIMRYERYIAIGFMALILLGILDGPLNILSKILYEIVFRLAAFPFRFFI